MIPEWGRWFEFVGALTTLAGVFDWLRKDSAAEDEMVVEASNVVLEALSDADGVTKINCVTERNLREQVTIEEAVALGEERDLRGFGWKRN